MTKVMLHMVDHERTEYECDICKRMKRVADLIGLRPLENEVQERDPEKSPRHICFACAKSISAINSEKWGEG